MQTRDDIALLLRLLKQPRSADVGWPAGSQWDWRDFARACDYHQVTPFVYCRLLSLAEIPVPPGLLEHLRARFLEVSCRNYHLAKQLVELTSRLKEHEIPVMAFKGPTLAMLAYGDLALRWYQDLDVVIRPEHLAKAVRVMTRCGFEFTPDYWSPRLEDAKDIARHHEIALRAPDKSYFVDLHWQLADHKARAFRLDVDEAWSRSATVEMLEGTLSTLCREDLFLALCCHGTVHRWGRLKWLLDISELLRNAETLNWSHIEEITRNRPLTRASAALAVLLARDLLKIDMPGGAMSILSATERTRTMAVAIRDEIMLWGHTSGENWTGLLRLEGSPIAWLKYWGVQSAWLFHQVFAQVTPKERALVDLPERLKFLYHFIRPVRLMLKHTSHAARTIWSKALP